MTTPTQPPTEGVRVAPEATQRAWRPSLIVDSTVQVGRDTHQHPSRGTWRHYRGRTGAVVEINRAGKGAPEYGVGFTKSRRVDAWFRRHELTVIGRSEDPQ